MTEGAIAHRERRPKTPQGEGRSGADIRNLLEPLDFPAKGDPRRLAARALDGAIADLVGLTNDAVGAQLGVHEKVVRRLRAGLRPFGLDRVLLVDDDLYAALLRRLEIARQTIRQRAGIGHDVLVSLGVAQKRAGEFAVVLALTIPTLARRRPLAGDARENVTTAFASLDVAVREFLVAVDTHATRGAR